MAEKTISRIQYLRKELTDLINNKVKPIRKELDELLILQAEKICPFKIGDIITLENGKKGKITEINYHSLDYDFYENEDENEFYSKFLNKLDVIEYQYAYEVDNKPFSITWKISGLRMIKKNTEVGKISFCGITPIDFLIHEKEKRIKSKPLNEYMTFDSLTEFENIK
ncbi:hypothetical protein V1T75_11625 [Tenacibaculum sp. FZY0031]|uniref:hypothetical protein n=1 Tax=Tenacibaculum sp. FZY0031 TaxID=3116648 RepID=UPI002E9BFBC7|nr:hypothetical protein [Tenacibaculum sp. FZY0031]